MSRATNLIFSIHNLLEANYTGKYYIESVIPI